ncbi:MAG: dihydroxy-acid dehydratase [Caldilineaceae bacterium]
MFDGRPVIGICNTWSDLTPCNGHFRILAEQVKRGIYEAGGYPLRVSCHVAGRGTHAANDDALSQSGQYGC